MKPHDTLSLAEREIQEQPSELKAYLSSMKHERAKPGSIFVGAGDSFAVAQLCFYISSGRMIALDPYTISESPKFATGKDVYIISISGRTKRNVELAKRLKGISSRTIAITANAESPLASEAGEIFEIPYRPSAKLPGTLSFSLSLIAALRLVLGEIKSDFRRAYTLATKRPNLVVADAGTTYFLGNHAMHAIAIYASAKTHEILGSKASTQLLEEFSHMEILSLSESDTVNILTGFDGSGVGSKLYGVLNGRSYDAWLLPSRGKNEIETLFHSIFYIQSAMVKIARSRGLSTPSFLNAKKQLSASDAMIY